MRAKARWWDVTHHTTILSGANGQTNRNGWYIASLHLIQAPLSPFTTKDQLKWYNQIFSWCCVVHLSQRISPIFCFMLNRTVVGRCAPPKTHKSLKVNRNSTNSQSSSIYTQLMVDWSMGPWYQTLINQSFSNGNVYHRISKLLSWFLYDFHQKKDSRSFFYLSVMNPVSTPGKSLKIGSKSSLELQTGGINTTHKHQTSEVEISVKCLHTFHDRFTPTSNCHLHVSYRCFSFQADF